MFLSEREVVADTSGRATIEVMLEIPEGLHVNSSAPPARWLVPTEIQVNPIKGEIAWPDAEGDNGYRTFSMTLKRLRTALGSNEVIQLRNGQLALNPQHCWVDYTAFEGSLACAQNQSSDLKKPLSLYQGLFLKQDTDLLWITPLRERLNGKFLYYYSLYGQQLEKAGQWQDAISWYYHGLDVDPSSEALCQRLIDCYQHLNQQAEAHAAQRRYQKIAASLRGNNPVSEIGPLLHRTLN